MTTEPAEAEPPCALAEPPAPPCAVPPVAVAPAPPVALTDSPGAQVDVTDWLETAVPELVTVLRRDCVVTFVVAGAAFADGLARAVGDGLAAAGATADAAGVAAAFGWPEERAPVAGAPPDAASAVDAAAPLGVALRGRASLTATGAAEGDVIGAIDGCSTAPPRRSAIKTTITVIARAVRPTKIRLGETDEDPALLGKASLHDRWPMDPTSLTECAADANSERGVSRCASGPAGRTAA